VKVVMRDRKSASSNVYDLPLHFEVDRYSHHAFGGPKTATITATGPDMVLWELISKIRSPLEIYADNGDIVWWGYVGEVTAQVLTQDAINQQNSDDRVQVGINIDSMHNRLWLAYTEYDLSGTAIFSSRQTYGPLDGTISQYEYGTVELLWTKDGATETHATAALAMKLEQEQYPQVSIRPATSKNSQAKIIGRGWWSTMSWRLYNNAGTAAVDTATQVQTIIENRNQFFEDVERETDSGITISEYRDGDATALYECLQLLEMGTSNNKRMLVTITPQMIARIYEEPDVYDAYLVSSAGKIFDKTGVAVPAYKCPVGVWAEIYDVIPPSVDITTVNSANRFFIEESEYIASEDRLVITPRGYLDPWHFPVVRDG
jgi:hypothetical protein